MIGDDERSVPELCNNAVETLGQRNHQLSRTVTNQR